MVTELEMKYRRLSRNYDEIEEKYEAAQEELKNARDELYSARQRIDNELEPRIKKEKDEYDDFKLRGSNPCFGAALDGACGLNCCDGFGSTEKCKELLMYVITDKELVKWSKTHEKELMIAQEIINRELY